LRAVTVSGITFHNREFLLKFALDRDGYRAKLREHLPEFEVGLLEYCITSQPLIRTRTSNSSGRQSSRQSLRQSFGYGSYYLSGSAILKSAGMDALKRSGLTTGFSTAFVNSLRMIEPSAKVNSVASREKVLVSN
jgi:hypothetical protein